MSDLRLPELARLLGKDARTTRRWCERGLIAGAYRTAGGHWRVKGEAEVVAGAAGRKARGFSRKRKRRVPQSPFTAPLGGVQAAIARQMARPLAAMARMQRTLRGCRYRVLARAQEELSRRKSIFPPATWEELTARPLALRESKRLILWGGLVAAMVEMHEKTGRCSRTALAQRFGVSRRTFGRVFGKVWREAQNHAACVIDRAESAPGWGFGEQGEIVASDGGEIDFAAMDARNGWHDPRA